MSAREIIAETELNIGLPSDATAAGLVARGYVGEPFADKALGRLAAAGYRLIPPGQLDRETIEKCAAVAEGWETHAAGNDYQTSGNGRFWDAGTNYDQGRVDAAANIRALGAEK